MDAINVQNLFAFHNSCSPTIGLAETEEERADVRRFWYEVYVEEMQRNQLYAEHEQHIINDPLEPYSHILTACEDGKIVGTVQINFTNVPGADEYVRLYGCREDREFIPDRSSIVTRFMVSSEHRASRLGFRLLWALYDFGVSMGATTCYMDCNAHLVTFFERIGFRPCRAITHPEYGDVTVMRMDVFDLEHLGNCNSLFADSLARLGLRPVEATSS